MIKQKTIFLSTLLLILILGTNTLGATVEDLNTSLDNRWLGKESMRNILNELNIEIAEEEISGYTFQFNEWFKTIENKNVTLKNIVFYKYKENNNDLFWIIGNGTFGDNSLNHLYLKMTEFGQSYSTSGTKFQGFQDWTYTNEKITGASTKIEKVYYCNANYLKETTTEYALTRIVPSTGIIELENVYIDQVVTALPTYSVYGYTTQYGYKTYFLTHTYELAKTEEQEPTPSGDTGGDTGGGTITPDYSQDLDNIQTGINDINNNLGNIQESIPTSGEIAGATEQGNKDFWGNKDEMSEEDYENQINEGINDSMNQISEELEQNEIFNSIAIAEQKIIDLFLEEPEDFKISWKDVKYMEKTLVPAGEINFSQMCEENETLGRVKNILNIIVSAMISLSLFKYIFNLIMVTLGIDNPLILETQKDDITEISSTKIGNKTYVTKRTFKSDKKGGR